MRPIVSVLWQFEIIEVVVRELGHDAVIVAEHEKPCKRRTRLAGVIPGAGTYQSEEIPVIPIIPRMRGIPQGHPLPE